MPSRLDLFRGALAARLAVGTFVFAMASLALVSGMLYFGTIGVLSRGIDASLRAVSGRLVVNYETKGKQEVRDEIERLLGDDEEVDTEVYALFDSQGRPVIGNLSALPDPMLPVDQLSERQVVRAGHPVLSRLLSRRLGDGALLVVGRKMDDQLEIEHLVVRALATGGAAAFALAVAGAMVLRRTFEHQMTAVRHITANVDTGDLSIRIPVPPNARDEFSHLGLDINRMLDRIQNLMDGVRHVSNAIAHDLRTPLGCIRAKLESALRQRVDLESTRDAVGAAIDGIDDLISVFEKLLLIAEVESGASRHALRPVPLGPIMEDIAELYAAMAEEREVHLIVEVTDAPTVLGDRDLIATAMANLVNNALKYNLPEGEVRIETFRRDDHAEIVVRDNGPGIPHSERENVLRRFYRLDQARSQPGNGLGLSLVAAVAALHQGLLELDDASPGLIARITLPLA